MVDLEGSPPPSAAASHRKVSHRHCSQVGCCFSLLIVLCLLCLLRFFFLLFCHRHCLRSSPDLSSFLHSLSCCLLVVFYSSAPGGAPARSLPWPWRSSVFRPRLGAPCGLLTSSPSTWCSAQNLRPRLGHPIRPRIGAPPRFLGAPHETCGLGPFLRLPGSSPSTRCSAQNLRPCLRAPPWLLGVLPRFLGAPH
jgi:hypothetical protein